MMFISCNSLFYLFSIFDYSDEISVKDLRELRYLLSNTIHLHDLESKPYPCYLIFFLGGGFFSVYPPPHSSCTCSKCRTLKTSSQTVSVQVQPVRYQSQTGHDPNGYNPVNYQYHYHWARSRLLLVLIRTLAIYRALNATQGHKRSYQTSY